jgi:hypothetical protein
MHRLLPRQLRDMVYKKLLGDDLHCQHTASHKHPGYGNIRWQLTFFKHHPDACDADYFGQVTYNELAEMWYELAHFRLDHKSGVANLFEHDIGGLDFDLRQHIRDLRIAMKPSDINPETHVPGPGDVRMPKNLETLAEIEKSRRVTIFLNFREWSDLEPTNDEVCPWFVALAVILPALEELMAKGTKIWVKVDDAEAVRLTKEDLNVESWVVGLFGRRTIEEDA